MRKNGSRNSGGICCRKKIQKESENEDSEAGHRPSKETKNIKYLELTEQFDKGKDLLIKELDCVNVIKKLRKIELMQKILFSLPQSVLLNYQKKNLID